MKTLREGRRRRIRRISFSSGNCPDQAEEAQHPRHLGRRHRPRQHQRLQPRHHGLPDAEHRPDREGRRALHRRLRAAELHRGSRVVHPRRAPLPHRAAHHRHAGLAAGHPRLGAHHRRPAQAAGLRHRTVRQEPPRRPRHAPADGARLRRVPRQPLPPERRGRAGDVLLPEGSGVQEEVRPARRAPHLVGRQGRTEDRGHRAADPRADADGRSGDLRRGDQVHRRAVKAKKPFFVWFNTTRMHVWTHLKPSAEGAPASASTPTAWSSTTTWWASC